MSDEPDAPEATAEPVAVAIVLTATAEVIRGEPEQHEERP